MSKIEFSKNKLVATKDRSFNAIHEALKEIFDEASSGEVILTNELAERLVDRGAIMPTLKIGDTVYQKSDINGKLYQFDIVCIQIYQYDTIYIDDCYKEFSDDDIGKSVFLTKEEAERQGKNE